MSAWNHAASSLSWGSSSGINHGSNSGSSFGSNPVSRLDPNIGSSFGSNHSSDFGSNLQRPNTELETSNLLKEVKIIKFDQDLQNLINSTIELQEKLYSLYKGNFKEIHEFITTSQFLSSEKNHKALVDNVILAASKNELFLQYYFDFISFLLNMKPELKNLFLTQFFNDKITKSLFQTQIYFLRFCYEKSLFTIHQIIDSISSFYQKKSNLKYQLEILFIYFAPEIEQTNKILFRDLYSILRNDCNVKNATIKHFQCCYAQYHMNQWEELKNMYLKEPHNEIIEILKNDDIKLLITKIMNGQLTINSKINPMFFYCPCFQHSMSLFEMSIFFNSLQIFTFLEESNASINLNRAIKFSIISKNFSHLDNFLQACLNNSPLDFVTCKKAISFHNIELFWYTYVKHFCNVSVMDKKHCKLLEHCITHNSLRIFIFLLECKLYLNYDCTKSIPLIHKTIEKNDPLYFRILLSYEDIDLSIVDNQGNTALNLCLENKNYLFARKILEFEAVSTDPVKLEKMFLLMVNHPNLLKLLISKNVNVNCVNSKGYSILHLSVLHSNIETLKLLLETPSIDLSMKNKQNYNAASIAIKKDNIEILKLLLSKKPEIVLDLVVFINYLIVMMFFL
ncbi:hypothetical protein TRFO_02622 [Tritrichomonas foetus]|uniref:Uncharacterized protein n=1 Tax=Tritrichomonas foetus TaxID=1144522 RepID=A0A1J4L6B7_9EUKA|nr:hypothetical protein TRFO_02622 [Tritrichomonas foetus]|eukprot:OHT17556.1 hypothetical protein TRFO_02622 [Tritrichomonas foetus]